MRIIAGTLKARQFDSPKNSKTHPMSEKMRGALFNVLGDIEDLTVFDAYGGSGAIAFEAISRGAKAALICENDDSAAGTISKNIRNLALGNSVKIVKANAASWASANSETLFDLVICDPPYDGIDIGQLDKLAENTRTGRLFIVSLPSSINIPEFAGLIPEAVHEYGDSRLAFYRKA